MRSLALAVVVSLSLPAFAQAGAPIPMVRQVSSSFPPLFPESERAKGVKLAIVKMELVIDARGNVTQVTLKEGAGGEFDKLAIKCAKETQFVALEKKTKGKSNIDENRDVLTTQPWEVKFELR